jgi:L-fuconolactonase
MLDAHQHFWKVDRGDYGWMSPSVGPLLRDFGPDDLSPLMRRAGVTRTVVVQAAETEAETDYMLSIAATTDAVAGVVGWLDMTRRDFTDRLAVYRAKPKWVGIRPMLQEHDPARILDPVFLDNLAHVAREQVPFDILTFPRHLPNMIEALRRAPGLHGVVDHLSKPAIATGTLEPWASHMAEIARIPTIYCKISGMVTEAAADWSLDDFRPFVRHVATCFGPDRLIFGSDWPVCTLAGGYADVVAIARTLLSEIYGPNELARIFEVNGVRFYGL